MAKLGKSQLPSGHTFSDFKAFGPVASKDGEFAGTKMADFGCFTQDGKNSNKEYHCAVVQSKQNLKWFVYSEWGRVGNSKKDFQFAEHASELNAQFDYEKICHSKNDKRGVWTEICGIKTLQAKPNKDIYKCRSLQEREVYITDAKNITNAPTAAPISKSIASTKSTQYDSQSTALIRDLMGGTISYTRSSMSNNTLPSADAIDMGRKLLLEAQKHLHLPAPNTTLRDITYELYSRIPKRLATKDTNWLLSPDNIMSWQHDLDAYESALSAQTIETSDDSFGQLPFDLKYVDKNTNLGEFLYSWWPSATANRHSYLGQVKIKGIWEIFKDDTKFKQARKEISAKNKNEFIPFQEKIKKSPEDNKANVHWLHHGTRSCNLLGILKEGLRLPRTLSGVTITGQLIGPMLYFASDVKKSIGYTSLGSAYWARGGGSIPGRSAFMFLGEVILGDIYVTPTGYNQDKPPAGFNSVMGKANFTNCGYSKLQNDEYVVPSADQTKLRYLVEFDQ